MIAIWLAQGKGPWFHGPFLLRAPRSRRVDCNRQNGADKHCVTAWLRANHGTFPIPRREIETHSANMHMIPADAAVAYQLKRVRAGDVVSLDGMLVEADKANGWR
jgi:hypothetical protein